MYKRSCKGMIGLVAAALAVSPLAAHATTITFANLTKPGSGITSMQSYTSNGFTFSTDLADQHSNSFISPNESNVLNAGETALAQGYAGNPIILAPTVAGETFSISSIDLSALYPPGFVAGAPGESLVTFTGTKADTTTVQDTFLVDSFGFVTNDFTSDFTDLVSLTWFQGSSFTPLNFWPHQFTNVDVTLSGGRGSVPEPDALPALIIGSLGIAMMVAVRRTRTAKVLTAA